MSRRGENGSSEHPWIGHIVVQWQERHPSDYLVHEKIVWSGQPRWDAPGYSSDEAENQAREDAANRLAEVLSFLCGPGWLRTRPPTPELDAT